jgi:hypothetical protein
MQPNGDDAQISWNIEARSWVIASRSTTILAEFRKHADS